jgi:hypothetical protein
MGVSGQRHAPAALLPPGKEPPGTYCTGGWVGLRAVLDTEDRGKILCSCRGSNSDRPVVQPVVSHYTVWANPAPLSWQCNLERFNVITVIITSYLFIIRWVCFRLVNFLIVTSLHASPTHTYAWINYARSFRKLLGYLPNLSDVLLKIIPLLVCNVNVVTFRFKASWICNRRRTDISIRIVSSLLAKSYKINQNTL